MFAYSDKPDSGGHILCKQADRIRVVYEGHEEVFRCIRSEK